MRYLLTAGLRSGSAWHNGVGWLLVAIDDTLTPKQQKAIAALLAEPTVERAAARVGIGHRTLHRWQHEDPIFADAYRDARRAAVTQAIARLQQVSSAAVCTLASVMADDTERGATRVTAARVVLELALRAVELEDLEQRITMLEAAATAPR